MVLPSRGVAEYLYDINHSLMTEINVSTQQKARANIYAGSVLLAEDAPDAYLTNTPTATLLRITDNVGTLRGRQDLGSNWDGACTSFPYGDGMACPAPRVPVLGGNNLRFLLIFFGGRIAVKGDVPASCER